MDVDIENVLKSWDLEELVDLCKATKSTYLRFDEDHEILLTCLELSDIEGCDNEDDDSENENGNADGIREENVEEQSEINAENFNEEDIEEDLEIQSDFESDESDPEMNIPLSTLKDQWGRKS
ncbi:hypothetical protein JTB14_033768 [Gonioctena quinquepunctata]|nr:hypothetical protein JTB14_033768 [Gonioctena quinquepunctata]